METPENSLPPPSSPPPHQTQPDPKRLKMSTTTTDDEQNTLPPNHPRKLKYKRRKIAIFFAYCGVGYQGMQKNPGAKTIEGDLEEALFQSGAVPEEDRGQPKRFDWARSARTDKGVSAVGQVVSGRFYVDPTGFVERLNGKLVDQIRVFGFKRATPSFNAKKFCDRRRYVYLIPVFALDKERHRDRESVMMSLGTGEELVKCLECSERGRKVYGLMGNSKNESKIDTNVTVEVGNEGLADGVEGKDKEFDGNDEKNEASLVKNETLVDSVEVKNNGSDGNDASSEIEMDLKNGVVKKEEIEVDISSKSEDNLVKNETLVDSVEVKNNGSDGNNASSEIGMDLGNGVVKNEKTESANGEETTDNVFCYGEEEKERFNRVLKYYEGTHNFHNFTTRTKAEDPAAKRYILSFTANTVVNVDGIDFIKCEVLGQSFMLHQIRKMIGLAVAIMRNYAPESLIETAFSKDVKITVPMAPEVGLYLDECFFPSYNVKWKDTHEELSMKDYSEEAENFKMKHIYPHIASMEHKYGNMALWLHSLNYRNYPDLRFADNIHDSGLNTNEVSNNVENAALSANEVSDNVQNSALNASEVGENVQNSISSEVKNDEIVSMVE